MKKNMLQGVKGIIFDMDGSLIDSMWMWPEVDRIYMEKYQLEMPENFHKVIEGMSYTETAQYFLDTFSEKLTCTLEEIQEEWNEMTLELYRTKTPLKPGAGEFLERMREAGIPMGIATSNGRKLTEAALEGLKIRDYFLSVHTSDEVPKGKPAPDVYLLTAKEMGVAPSECLVFEDIPNGIMAGKCAGMKVCAVDDDFSRPYKREKEQLADYYIYNYKEIWEETFD